MLVRVRVEPHNEGPRDELALDRAREPLADHDHRRPVPHAACERFERYRRISRDALERDRVVKCRDLANEVVVRGR